uniref:Uncharacterized protein n=1 Tax=Zea mays TaxID=4577 RepID=B6TNF7_MAIZE|nr:hypothetical protein [Zea mays]
MRQMCSCWYFSTIATSLLKHGLYRVTRTPWNGVVLLWCGVGASKRGENHRLTGPLQSLAIINSRTGVNG